MLIGTKSRARANRSKVNRLETRQDFTREYQVRGFGIQWLRNLNEEEA